MVVLIVLGVATCSQQHEQYSKKLQGLVATHFLSASIV